MAIYVAQNNAVLLKKDRSVTELYKGDKKLFGYESAQGENIRIDDVNPIEHKLKIALKSDIVTDFSGVTVIRCGKNILKNNYAYASAENNGITLTDNGDGTFSLNGRNNGLDNSTLLLKAQSLNMEFLKPNVEYALSFEGIDRNLCMQTRDKNGNAKYYSHGSANFSADEVPYRMFIQIPKGNATVFENLIIKPQIELGSKATPYEPYTEQTAIATADGIVEGLTSVSQSMTLYTDSQGVTIGCKYVKK